MVSISYTYAHSGVLLLVLTNCLSLPQGPMSLTSDTTDPCYLRASIILLLQLPVHFDGLLLFLCSLTCTVLHSTASSRIICHTLPSLTSNIIYLSIHSQILPMFTYAQQLDITPLDIVHLPPFSLVTPQLCPLLAPFTHTWCFITLLFPSKFNIFASCGSSSFLPLWSMPLTSICPHVASCHLWHRTVYKIHRKRYKLGPHLNAE